MYDIRPYIENILARDVNEAVKVCRQEIDTVSMILYKFDCGNCDNKRIEIYMRLYNDKDKINQKIKTIMERNYELKAGAVLTIPALGLTVSNNNLTDEIAKQIIKYNPVLINQFVKVPDEPKEEIPEAAKPKVKTKKQTKA